MGSISIPTIATIAAGAGGAAEAAGAATVGLGALGAGTGAGLAAGGLAAGELAGGALGAGALEGTTAAGLSAGFGSILPEGALASGALAGAGGLASGALDLGGGVGAAEGVPLGAGVLSGTLPTGLGAAGGVPEAAGALGAPLSGGVLGGAQTGPLGGAAASAAPVSAPATPTTTGAFQSFPSSAAEAGGDVAPGAGAPGAAATDPYTIGGAAKAPVGGEGAWVDAVPDPAKGSLAAFGANPGFGTAWDAIAAHPGVALSAAGLGANILRGTPTMPGQGALNAQAARLSAQGEQLQGYLNSGTLPPGVQSGLTSAGASAKATIRSRHASSGTSGSSAEATELAAVDSQIATQGTNMALQLFQSGLNESQIAAQLYTNIVQGAIQQDAQLGNAIGSFASAVALSSAGAPVIYGRTG